MDGAGNAAKARVAQRHGSRGKPAPVPPPDDGWIGLILHTRGGLAFVKRVVPGWPADEAGLLPGDQLLSVDGNMAQAPRLEEALDAFSGPAGEALEIVVSRPGLLEPLALAVVRTSRPVRETPPAASGVSKEARQAEQDRQMVSEAVDRWSRGRGDALEEVLNAVRGHGTARGAETLNCLGVGLLDLGGTEAWRAALSVAKTSIDLFPESPRTVDTVKECFSSGTGKGALMRELAESALESLEGMARVPEAARQTAIREWQGVHALGWLRDGQQRRGEKALLGALAEPPVHVSALRADGTSVWHAAVAPARGWKDYVENALQAGRLDQAWEGLLEVLRLDEPAWVYLTVEELRARCALGGEAAAILAPRWPLPRYRPGWELLEDIQGVAFTTAEILQGRPAIVLECTPYDQRCERWRVALSDVVRRQGAYAVALLIVNDDESAPPSSGTWPVYSVKRRESGAVSPTSALWVLDFEGMVIAAYGEYEAGLEYRVMEQMQTLHEEPDAAGPYLARGGIGQSSWTLRWSRWDRPVYDVGWGQSGRGIPRMWVLGRDGSLEVLQEGEVRATFGGLSRLNRLAPVELDGDPGEELLAYQEGGGLLEALDGGRTPQWILPGEDPIRQALAYDLDGDGRQEVVVVRGGDTWLGCYTPRGALKWRARVPGGIRQVEGGGSVWAGRFLAVLSNTGDVLLFGAEGRPIGELSPVLSGRWLVLADIDSDSSDEFIVAGDQVEGIVARDLNGDGLPEFAIRSGSRQILVFRSDGRLATRLTWEETWTSISAGSLDGDDSYELTVLSPDGEVTVMNWLDPEQVDQ